MTGSSNHTSNVLFRFRVVLILFIVGLVFSGITAFPLQQEVTALASSRSLPDAFKYWILLVRDGLQECYGKYPWLAYGTDWLAFAHLVLAIFFIGPLVHPVRNVWVLYAGLIACVLVIPLALVCGEIRQIPLGWRLIDCSFGVFGAVPLIYCLWLVRQLEPYQEPAKPKSVAQ